MAKYFPMLKQWLRLVNETLRRVPICVKSVVINMLDEIENENRRVAFSDINTALIFLKSYGKQLILT